jgi:hypothetical protein
LEEKREETCAGVHPRDERKSYKRGCQETFFRARRAGAVQDGFPASSPLCATMLVMLIVVGYAAQQQDSGFALPAVSLLVIVMPPFVF